MPLFHHDRACQADTSKPAPLFIVVWGWSEIANEQHGKLVCAEHNEDEGDFLNVVPCFTVIYRDIPTSIHRSHSGYDIPQALTQDKFLYITRHLLMLAISSIHTHASHARDALKTSSAWKCWLHEASKANGMPKSFTQDISNQTRTLLGSQATGFGLNKKNVARVMQQNGKMLGSKF